MWRRIAIAWKQWRCEHYWRPAVSAILHCGYRRQFKLCDYCDKQVELSTPEFYAQFGRMPW